MQESKLELWKEKLGEIPIELRDRVKESRKLKKLIREALREEEKTIPELSKELGYPTDKIFWFITSMRKYGDVGESNTHKDLYYSYRLISKE